MKTNLKTIVTTSLAIFLLAVSTSFSQSQRKPASLGREEYIEVEKNVKLHVTDLGEGKPVVLIHGWPLSDAMYEYQYAELIQKGYRVIGITLRGFGLSDKPRGAYNYDVYADDIKVILDKLKIEGATIGGFSMGGATVIHYVPNTTRPTFQNWHCLVQQLHYGQKEPTLITVSGQKKM